MPEKGSNRSVLKSGARVPRRLGQPSPDAGAGPALRRGARVLYLPAFTQQEADSLVQAGYGHDTREEAEKHLTGIKLPPTDPFYGNQYHVYRCVVYPRVDSIKVTMRPQRRTR
jgi:hypothetical protein